jgi:FkbM family methyltransferase
MSENDPSGVSVVAWEQPAAVEALVAALRRAVPDARRFRLCGAAAAAWSERLTGDGVLAERYESVDALPSGPPADVVVVCSPDVLPVAADGEEAFVAALVAAAPVALVATLNPAGAAGRPGRWPAYWADRFGVHGWRLADAVRGGIWHDSHVGPDVKEGALLFVGPGADAGPVTAPLAVLHPHRQTETLQVFEARLERFRAELAEVAAGGDAAALRMELRAAQARVAALDRRVSLLTDRALDTASGRGVGAEAARALVGRLAGRTHPASADAVTATLFDPYFYAEQNPSVDGPLFEHYLRHGEAEGRRPNPYFDPVFYRAANPDVVAAGLSPLGHYAHFGGAEGRAASAEFDTAWYVGRHPEVLLSGLHPMVHFLSAGESLGYAGSPAAAAAAGAAYPSALPAGPPAAPPIQEAPAMSRSTEADTDQAGRSLWGTYVGNGRVLVLLRTGGHLFLSADDITLVGDLLREGMYDVPFTRFLQRTLRPTSTVVDVGANVGLFSVVAGRSCTEGRVIAYEAAPRPAALLRDNVVANWLTERVTVRPVAVGAAAGTATFRFPTTMHTLGSLDLDAEAFAEQFPGVELQEHAVSVVTLDDDLDALGLTGVVDLVKVDVEGGEAEVLRGLHRHLEAGRIARLSLEVRRDVQIRNRGAASWDALLGELRTLGRFGGSFADLDEDGSLRRLTLADVERHGVYANLVVLFPAAGEPVG